MKDTNAQIKNVIKVEVWEGNDGAEEWKDVEAEARCCAPTAAASPAVYLMMLFYFALT